MCLQLAGNMILFLQKIRHNSKGEIILTRRVSSADILPNGTNFLKQWTTRLLTEPE